MKKDELNILASAHSQFIEYLKAQRRSISTILAYGKDVSQLIEFLNQKKITQSSSVTSAHLEEFKSGLIKEKYTLKSVSRKLNSIRTFFRFLADEKVITDNPAASISHPKYEIKPPRILTPMEYRALRDACRQDARIAGIIELMLQTGIRIGEISRLELNDLKNEEINITAYQSQPARSIPLNKAAKTALDRYLTERGKIKTNALFVTKTSRPLLVRNIRAIINRYLRLAGIQNARVNDLRNTWLAYHLREGTSPVFLAKIAGHKRLTTTERYLQFIKDEKPGEKGKMKLEEL